MFVLSPVAVQDYDAVTQMEFMFTMESSQPLPVTTVEDMVAETAAETFTVVIDGITGPANVGPPLTLTITDDDSKLPDPHMTIVFLVCMTDT